MSMNHHITVGRAARPVTVHFHDNIIATTDEALVLKEGSYPEVFYIPKKHVNMEFLLPTERHTTCPHKGEASYWTISAGGRAADNAVWGYDNPREGVAEIADHVAFYPDKVLIKVG